MMAVKPDGTMNPNPSFGNRPVTAPMPAQRPMAPTSAPMQPTTQKLQPMPRPMPAQAQSQQTFAPGQVKAVNPTEQRKADIMKRALANAGGQKMNNAKQGPNQKIVQPYPGLKEKQNQAAQMARTVAKPMGQAA